MLSGTKIILKKRNICRKVTQLILLHRSIRQNKIFEYFDYKKIMKLNKHILVNHICYCESENKEYYQQLIDKLFESIGQGEYILFIIIYCIGYRYYIKIYSIFLHIPDYKESCKYDKSTGAIQLAFNYGCKIIFPKEGYNDGYQLSSPIEYISPSSIKLNKEPHKDVFDERNKLISKEIIYLITF